MTSCNTAVGNSPDLPCMSREFAGQIAALALDSLDLFQYTWGFFPLAASCSLGDEAIKAELGNSSEL